MLIVPFFIDGMPGWVSSLADCNAGWGLWKATLGQEEQGAI